MSQGPQPQDRYPCGCMNPSPYDTPCPVNPDGSINRAPDGSVTLLLVNPAPPASLVPPDRQYKRNGGRYRALHAWDA